MALMKSHAWQILVVALAGWLNRQQQDVVEYLQEDNHLRRAREEFMLHDHGERNHQGLDNTLIGPEAHVGQSAGEIKRREW